MGNGVIINIYMCWNKSDFEFTASGLKEDELCELKIRQNLLLHLRWTKNKCYNGLEKGNLELMEVFDLFVFLFYTKKSVLMN